MEASGLYESITEPSFLFLANVTHKVLGLMEPPNRMLQAERTDLLTAVQLINSASDCLRLLRSEEEFTKIWNETGSECDAPPPKRQRQPPKALQPYVVEETLGHPEQRGKEECQRLFYALLDRALAEMDARFSERNNKYLEALSVLDPSSQDFLNTEKVKPLLDLTQTEMDEAQFIVARQFVRNQDGETLTLGQLVSKAHMSFHHSVEQEMESRPGGALYDLEVFLFVMGNSNSKTVEMAELRKEGRRD
ncbi:unnamed protein product [Boreogadus saida]